MNDLEDRLRTTLGDLAEGVPPSPHARADLDQRLARRRTGRRTLVVAAAAVVVVAGVAIPVAINQSGEPGGRRVATSTAPTTPTSATNIPGLPANAMVLGSFTEEGIEKKAFLVDAGDQYCVITVVAKGPIGEPACQPMPTTWPTPVPPGQGPGSLVIARSVLSGNTLYSGPLPNLMLFITAPQITSLDVTDGAGVSVPVRELVARGNATFFLAEFPDTPAGFGYTAKDAAGNDLETAIT